MKLGNVVRILKWPINICLFELAVSFGVGKFWMLHFGAHIVPEAVLLISYVLISFPCAYIVCKYMPSEKSLPDGWLQIVWINLTIVLAAFTPITIFYTESPYIYLLAVIVGVSKSWIDLHLKLKDQNGDSENNYGYDHAFALPPFKSSVLIAVVACCCVVAFKLKSQLFLFIACATLVYYMIESVNERVTGVSKVINALKDKKQIK